ncbi:MAG: hypothetical protein NUV64_03575 [Parcubacteria group bacterium]|nr:hypothetical protein [Parcubacteria group bacterium]MCR4342333.1 hypothetical protein [Patescibacteria group bacterium]
MFLKNGAISRQGGLIKMIIIFIIVILILSVLNIDIRSIVESEEVQTNFSYIWNFAKIVWSDYLSDPVTYFWNNIFISLLWTSFVDNMERIKAGEPTEMMLNAPRIDFVQ